MPEYYGGAPNAFYGGMEYGAHRRAQQKKENALAALIEQYGPTAADPQSTALMQRTQQSGELHPYDVSEAQRVDAARAAEVASGGARMGDPAVHARDVAAEERTNVERLNAGRRAAAVLQLVKARKGDLGKAFDMVANVLPDFGIPADRLAEAREEIVNNPDSVDELVALMQGLPDPSKRGALAAPISVRNKATGAYEIMQPMADGNNPIIPGYEMAQTVLGAERNATGRGNLTQRTRALTIQEFENRGGKALPGYEAWEDENGNIQQTPIPGTKAAQEFEETQTAADTSDRKFLRIAASVVTDSTVVSREAARALSYYTDAKGGPLPQIYRAGTRFIPGFDAAKADDALKTLKAKVSIETLQEMRQNSPTGGALGNVTERELDVLESALGRLDPSGDPARLVENINFIVTEYARIVDLAQQDATLATARLERRAQPRAALPAGAAPGGSRGGGADPLGIRPR